MNEVLTYTPKTPVEAANPGMAVAHIALEWHGDSVAHAAYSIEQIHLRADTITQTLKSILDFHPMLHPEVK